jgi:DNA repair protein RadA/Sms
VCAAGEISLAGEIRPAAQSGRRAAEARRLGYGTLLGPDAATVRGAIQQAVQGGDALGPER